MKITDKVNDLGHMEWIGHKEEKMKYRTMEKLFAFNYQMFAEDGDGAGDDTGNEDGNGDEDEDDDKQMTFDDFLKDKNNQKEFDRRVQKAINTAVGKAQKKWEALADDKLTEAEKLAKMSKDEKAQYLQQKEREEFEKEKAEFEREKLFVAVTKELTAVGLPVSFADSLTNMGDAESINDTIKEIKKEWDAQIAEAIKAKARQGEPGAGGYRPSGKNGTPSMREMAKKSRIIK